MSSPWEDSYRCLALAWLMTGRGSSEMAFIMLKYGLWALIVDSPGSGAVKKTIGPKSFLL